MHKQKWVITYCNNTSKALSYFLKAQKIKPHDFIIANQIGFIENNLELNKEAYQQFNNATHSPDNITSSQAEVALVNLSNWRYKYLPDPWYFEFYTEPYYTSRFTDYIAPLEARLGAALGRYKQFMVYLSYKQSTDTQSTGSGTAPQIYNDNAGVIVFLGFFMRNMALPTTLAIKQYIRPGNKIFAVALLIADNGAHRLPTLQNLS
ncbi:MAG: hypothetical protein NTU49_02750 [Gammaproteobacteria bacterium]|nr:hypothetical protein [Gammaproteobacteria bacterium]